MQEEKNFFLFFSDHLVQACDGNHQPYAVLLFPLAVKPFFKKILQPGDRLIVTSNSFFLNDRLVLDPEVERKKVEHIPDVEKVKAHWRYSWMTYEVDFKGMDS